MRETDVSAKSFQRRDQEECGQPGYRPGVSAGRGGRTARREHEVDLHLEGTVFVACEVAGTKGRAGVEIRRLKQELARVTEERNILTRIPQVTYRFPFSD